MNEANQIIFEPLGECSRRKRYSEVGLPTVGFRFSKCSARIRFKRRGTIVLIGCKLHEHNIKCNWHHNGRWYKDVGKGQEIMYMPDN